MTPEELARLKNAIRQRQFRMRLSLDPDRRERYLQQHRQKSRKFRQARQEKFKANPELMKAERERNRIRKAESRAKKKRQLLSSDISADKLGHGMDSTV